MRGLKLSEQIPEMLRTTRANNYQIEIPSDRNLQNIYDGMCVYNIYSGEKGGGNGGGLGLQTDGNKI